MKEDRRKEGTQGPRATREPYEKPAVLYQGELETMATVCDSVHGATGARCRVAAIPTCIRWRT